MGALEDQGVVFKPGVHMRWGFHATSPAAIESIVSDPLHGFTLTLAGETGSLWGPGVYFARDASYSHHFAAKGFVVSATDAASGKTIKGVHQMLLCLISVGLPCLGGANVKVALKVRIRPASPPTKDCMHGLVCCDCRLLLSMTTAAS